MISAAGVSLPVIGYIRTTVTLLSPDDEDKIPTSVPVMMVVCQDSSFTRSTPVVLGTNILHVLLSKLNVSIMPFITAANQLGRDGKVGVATIMENTKIVPPWTTFECKVRINANIPDTIDSVIVHAPSDTSLPEGLQLVSAHISCEMLPEITLVGINGNSVPCILEQGSTLANVFAYESRYVLCNDLIGNEGNVQCNAVEINEQVGNDKQEVEFQFGSVKETEPEWCNSFQEKLRSYSAVFSKSEFDIGRANTGTVFDIELSPGPDIRERARPLSPDEFTECKQHIQSLLEAKIIRPSNSPFASPIVLVRKKNGKLRMCVDYRKLNARTIRDSYNIPKIEDLLLTLNGAKYFSSLDLCKAYYQVPMTTKARKLSAFVTPFGLFEWDRLSFGLTNAPACFQRLMESVFCDMNLQQLIVFIDDVLIHAKTLPELEERTLAVLGRLIECNLKLDPSKCTFGATSVKHLGYVITEGNIKPDPDKVSAVRDWPKPETVKDVKSFLGFCSYYRRFVNKFAEVAQPLNALTAGYIPTKRGCRDKKREGALNLRSSIKHLWGKAQEEAFNTLKTLLTSDLVLGLADRTKPFTLHIDASGVGLGAVLYQRSTGDQIDKVIAYASSGLSKSEQMYPAHKREFLALKWAMTDKFRDYLLGSKVTVVTDNNPLCYVLKTAQLDATSHRWLAALSIFDFEIKYKQGILHTDADALSRLPRDEPFVDQEYMHSLERINFLLNRTHPIESIPADVCSACLQLPQNFYSNKNHDFPAVEQVVAYPCMIDDQVLQPPMRHDFETLDWRKLQLMDEHIRWITDNMRKGKRESLNPNRMHPEMKVYYCNWNRFVLRKGVLYRRVYSGDKKEENLQLVVPTAYRKQALAGVHEDLFHTHFDDAVIHLRKRFFWPFMAKDLKEKIKSCERCIRRNAKCEKAPMESIETTYPLELMSIDFFVIRNSWEKT